MKYIYKNNTLNVQGVILPSKDQHTVGTKMFNPWSSLTLDYPGLDAYVPHLLTRTVVDDSDQPVIEVILPVVEVVIPEPEPEPVVEVIPEPEPEPVVEVIPEPEPEPVVEVIPEPEPEPVVEVVSAPVVKTIKPKIKKR